MRPALLAIFLGAVVACCAFAIVVLRLDPHSGMVAPIAFFGTLFLALTGIGTLFIFGLRLWIQGNELVNRSMSLAFREGALLAVTIDLLLVLQAFRRLTWWAVLIVVAAALFAELTLYARIDDQAS